MTLYFTCYDLQKVGGEATVGQIVPVVLNLRSNDKGIFLSVAHVNCSQEVKSALVAKATCS